jgi:hypothetical protein
MICSLPIRHTQLKYTHGERTLGDKTRVHDREGISDWREIW